MENTKQQDDKIIAKNIRIVFKSVEEYDNFSLKLLEKKQEISKKVNKVVTSDAECIKNLIIE